MTDDALATEVFTKRRVVCQELVILRGNKLGVYIQEVGQDDTLIGNRRLYEAKTIRGSHPGMVYEIEMSERQIKPATARYVGRFKNNEQVLAWQTLTDAAETQVRYEKNLKKAGNTEEALKALGPLRDIYQSTDRIGRQAIELALLEYLRKPS